MSLADRLSRAAVRRLAGQPSFERGEDYALSGAVRITGRDDQSVTATVLGTRRYEVVLKDDSRELSYECTCPMMGREGHFCKHCVAVAGVVAGWLTAPGQSEPSVTMEDVREHLKSWRKPALIDLILSQAEEDERLRDILLMRVAGLRAGGPDVDTFRAALEDTINPGAFVDWREAWDWSQRVDSVIDSIEELLTAGHAEAVVALCEEALELIDAAAGQIDDSDGNTAPLVERLGELHLAACRRAKVDPVELGRRLVDLELGSEHEAFFGAIDRYADLLGKAGLQAYRTAAEQRWAGVPALAAGEREESGDFDRFRLTHVMERLAARSGNPDELVAVMSRDLRHGHDYLRIAEVYRDAGRFDDALNWAERGLAKFPRGTHSGLREFAADEQHRRGRHDLAMELIWKEFEELPGLTSYELLQAHAIAGDADWSHWSQRAISLLRSDIEHQAKRRDRSRWDGASDRSRLVEIHLHQGDVESAWREAQEGGCRPELWMRLAERREAEHPDEAVPVFQRQVERLLSHKHNQAYAEAIDVASRIRTAMARCTPPGNFTTYVASLRAEHRRLRNFMALLQKAGW